MSHGSTKEYDFALTRVWGPATNAGVRGVEAVPEPLEPPDVLTGSELGGKVLLGLLLPGGAGAKA